MKSEVIHDKCPPVTFFFFFFFKESAGTCPSLVATTSIKLLLFMFSDVMLIHQSLRWIKYLIHFFFLHVKASLSQNVNSILIDCAHPLDNKERCLGLRFNLLKNKKTIGYKS